LIIRKLVENCHGVSIGYI